MCLLQIGEVEEAFGVGREAFEQARDDARVLREVMAVALEAGHFRYARGLCGQWRELCPEEEAPPWERAVEDVAGALERGTFTEQSAQDALRIAHRERGEARIRMTHGTLRRDHMEADSFLHVIHVLAPNEVAVDLNERVIEKVLCQIDLSDAPEVKFMPMFIGTIANGNDEQGPA